MLRRLLLRFHRYPRKKLVIAAAIFVIAGFAFVLHASRQKALNTALYRAVDVRDVEAVRDALEHGADPNMMADARGRHLTLLQSLSFWKDKNAQSHSVPILMAALSWSDSEVYKPHSANDQDYMPALAKRTRQQTTQMLAIVQLLLKQGARVDAVDGFGETALSVASADGVPQLAACLLDNGADARHLDRNHRSALYDAVSSDDILTAHLLLQRGADPNIQTDGIGLTPLMTAVMYGNEEMAVLLLKAGADVTLRDCDGHTLLKYEEIDHFSPATRHLINLSIRRYRKTNPIQK